jgi:DNA modification methylase
MIFPYNNFPPNGFVPDIKQFLSQKKEVFAEHGATYPLALPMYFIEYFCKPGDIVLDPFHGMGTTSVGAIKLDRKWIGIELDPTYVKLSQERIDAELDQSLDFAPAIYKKEENENGNRKEDKKETEEYSSDLFG